MILITGQAGYIGSHVALRLLETGRDNFIGIDNLHSGLMSNNHGPCIIADIRNKEDVEKIFNEYDIDTVIHMAALTSVPESMEKKDEYMEVNVEGTENIIEAMKAHKCDKLIFSSTASVYEQSQKPVREIDTIQLLNNYALSKKFAEDIIKKNNDWLNAVIFRYFNVIGYDENYDKSKEYEKTNVVPAFLRAYTSNSTFKVFGNGYPVKRENPNDHTCVRDYIDVRDIANAHVLALEYLEDFRGQNLFNLGTKHGYSVLELIDAFNKANNVTINYTIEKARKGDPASIVADNQKARELLNWQPVYTIEQSLKIL